MKNAHRNWFFVILHPSAFVNKSHCWQNTVYVQYFEGFKCSYR